MLSTKKQPHKSVKVCQGGGAGTASAGRRGNRAGEGIAGGKNLSPLSLWERIGVRATRAT
jgi:hypothetical protein